MCPSDTGRRCGRTGGLVGRFVSPVQLPLWAGVLLTVAGVAAAVERALRLRSHPLLDADDVATG